MTPEEPTVSFPPNSRQSRLLIGFAALAGGMGSMALEVTAVRVMAPWFGTNVYSWTNVIGVVLACLAVGYLVGGRLADRSRTTTPAGYILVIGGLISAFTPIMVPPLAAFLVDPTLPLDAALGALAAASLPATVLIFGPPILLIGMVPPFLVKGWVGKEVDGIGRGSGMIYALGTIGSLGGTFMPTWWLVPTFGSQATLFSSGFLLVLTGGLVIIGNRQRLGSLSLLLTVSLLGLAGWGQWATPLGPPPQGDHQVLWEKESPYQFVRVVAASDGGKYLQLNEGLDSFHSVALASGETTQGRYYDTLCLAPLLAEKPLAESGGVLSLGSAGGTCLRLLRHLYGKSISLEGVEIDPACVQAGRDFLSMPEDARIHANVDARVFVRCAQRTYRFIVVDAYASQIYLPFQLVTREFFEQTGALLEPGGVLAVNVADPSHSGRLVRPLARTMAAAVGGEALLFKVPYSRNFMVAIKHGGPLNPEDLLHENCPAILRPLAKKLAAPGAWERIKAGPEPVLTDDLCPVEELTWAAYTEARQEALR